MTCKYGRNDCQNERTDTCILCVNSFRYVKQKLKNNFIKKRTTPRIASKRQGNIQEQKTYEQTKATVEGTPNSGAGKIKGDLTIGNMAMIECKTTTRKNINREPGKESFTIKKEWLTKLYKEAGEAAKEFAYLIFSFKEDDNHLYAITDAEEINSMIATMKHDREQLKENEKQIDIYKKRTALVEAENTKLSAEVEYWKAVSNANRK